MPNVLPDYDGHPVTGATVSIRNTGHGFENLLAAAPVALPLGSKHYVVLECEVEKHRYDPVKDSDTLVLVNMLKSGDRATFVDRELVDDLLAEQERRVAEARGEPMLDFDDDDAGSVTGDEEPADGFGLYDGSINTDDVDD